MNIVRTKTGELIHATQIKEDEVYFCPECGEEVTKKVSRNGVVFFSHIPKMQCDSYRRNYGANTTFGRDWHVG